MKVYIGPYVNYIGPFQIAEKILFWKDRNKLNETDPMEPHPDSDAIHNLGLFLEKIPGLVKFCQWYNGTKKRRIKVHIDGYDTWSADNTLAFIIVPVLKALKENKMGAPNVDDEDVPDHLKSTAAPPLSEEDKNCGIPDLNHFNRWKWVLDEMIWTFEQHSTDWEEQYYSGVSDFKFEKMDDGFSQMVHGPNHTFKVDREGMDKHRARMENGRKLFAKYYECLWS